LFEGVADGHNVVCEIDGAIEDGRFDSIIGATVVGRYDESSVGNTDEEEEGEDVGMSDVVEQVDNGNIIIIIIMIVLVKIIHL